MPFKPGQSGNPTGRPRMPRGDEIEAAASLKSALIEVCRKNPRLLVDAIERLLRGNRASLGMLELAAKLTGELKSEEQQGNKITITFVGTLNRDALRQVDAKVIDAECHQELKAPETTAALSLTTTQDRSAENSLKILPSAADYTVPSEQASQPQE